MSEGTSSSLREFVPLGKLGEGTFSPVYKVKRLSDQSVYALKKVLPPHSDQDRIPEGERES